MQRSIAIAFAILGVLTLGIGDAQAKKKFPTIHLAAKGSVWLPAMMKGECNYLGDVKGKKVKFADDSEGCVQVFNVVLNKVPTVTELAPGLLVVAKDSDGHWRTLRVLQAVEGGWKAECPGCINNCPQQTIKLPNIRLFQIPHPGCN